MSQPPDEQKPASKRPGLLAVRGSETKPPSDSSFRKPVGRTESAESGVDLVGLDSVSMTRADNHR